ncbi:hypothetical protein AAG570_002990 [Ranatra chinensis]|uniref:diphthine methyl ester synthase n=1 Tax=Ranatra chinensis TaxID=642074 RepID=A0ABD0YS76_9HEMI
MFFIVGIGLGGVKDITVKGLEVVKSADEVYLENYTSILSVGKESLEEYYGRELKLADREFVEQGCEEMLEKGRNSDVVLLVVGDPFSATTHTDLVLRAKKAGVDTQVIHNASILNAVGCCGLQLYSFGETVSIPFWMDGWSPDSFYDKICHNKERGLHTLCLLDIKVKEPTPESLTKKKKDYLPPLFMSVSDAAEQLMEIVKKRSIETDQQLPVDGETNCVGLARVGSETQQIIYCSLNEMKHKNLGEPLHSLVIIGDLHPLEEEFLALYL